MPFTAQGIYFRATDDQTDPTDYDMVLFSGSSAYPQTTAQGNTVGRTTAAINLLDRSATDVRLKGLGYASQSSTYSYRIDVPNGTYNVRAALGEPNAGHNCRLRILDGTTQRVDHDAGNVAAAHWEDASGVVRTSESDWVNNNAVEASISVTSGYIIFEIGGSTGNNGDPNFVVASLYVERAPTPPYITVPGLTAGTSYTFTVHATNAAGNSSESANSNSVTPTA